VPDLEASVDEIIALVEGARGVPLSTACVLDRPSLLAVLGELREHLPAELGAARQVVADRDAVIEEARGRAARIVGTARHERAKLVAGAEVAADAQVEADQIVAAARDAARAMRVEIDEYVDAKLAGFEAVLSRTMISVARGRTKLCGRTTAFPAASRGEVTAGADAEADARTGAEADAAAARAAACAPDPASSGSCAGTAGATGGASGRAGGTGGRAGVLRPAAGQAH
jgi:hypothetical protein